MLTSNDLKAIQALVKEEVDPLKKDVSGLSKDMSGLSRDVSGLSKDMKIIKRTLNRAVKDIKYMSGKFDADIVQTKRRVTKIEDHLLLNN